MEQLQQGVPFCNQRSRASTKGARTCIRRTYSRKFHWSCLFVLINDTSPDDMSRINTEEIRMLHQVVLKEAKYTPQLLTTKIQFPIDFQLLPSILLYAFEKECNLQVLQVPFQP